MNINSCKPLDKINNLSILIIIMTGIRCKESDICPWWKKIVVSEVELINLVITQFSKVTADNRIRQQYLVDAES